MFYYDIFYQKFETSKSVISGFAWKILNVEMLGKILNVIPIALTSGSTALKNSYFFMKKKHNNLLNMIVW